VTPGPNTDVQDNAGAKRFELHKGGVVAFASYQLRGMTVIITHTETPPPLRGRGIASTLIDGALRLIRDRGQRVVPGCSFVADYLVRHPEWKDLQAPRP